jgi:hypothetical protein
MQCNNTTTIIIALAILACAGSALADEPQSPLAKGRTLKLPEPNATPTPGEGEIIDAQRLAELANGGRIAAVSVDGNPASGRDEAPKTKARGRSYWRSQYRKQRDRVTALDTRARDLDEQERSLNRQWLTAGSAESRAAVDHRLDRVREQQRQTAADRRAAKSELQRITRMARAEGATPDWFRGLR